MIGRRRFAPAGFLTFAVGVVLWTGSSGAQAANLPPNVRQAINPGPVLPQIEAYIKEKLAIVTGDDVAAQSKAREDLVSEVMSTPGPVPTQAFLDAYAKALNAALLNVAKDENPRVRLNAAVIVARVADNAGNAALQPVTLLLLSDSSEATRVWALKAARAVLPHAVAAGANGGATPMIAAIVKIGQETRSGAVIQSVYEALTVDKGKVPGPAWAGVLSATVPALHEVLHARVAQYNSGTPEEPLSEGVATLYLTSKDIWPAQTPAQQFETIQVMTDLMGIAAQRTEGASNEKRQDIIQLIRRAAKAIQVAGQWPPPNAALAAAGNINLAITATAEEVQTEVNRIFVALQSVKGFEKLRLPPDVEASSTAATTSTK